MVQQGTVIGIDLGTASSCVGVYQRHRAEIITNEHGGRTTPPYVAFTATERLVGDAARDQAARNPTNTVFCAKRLMGRRFSDASVQADKELWPFKVIAGRGDRPLIAANYKGKEKQLVAEEVASMLLAKMKADAEAYLGGLVAGAVITVPVSFDILQRRATVDACAIAGINVLGVVDEPTAAAIAYGLHHERSMEPKNVLVFDLGGGNTSVSLLEAAAGSITVKATAGDPHLGGEDFNNRMVEHFVERCKAEYKRDVSRNARALVRLRAACEHAKRTLSSASWAAVEIDCLVEGMDFHTTITRDQFEDLNSDLFCRCLEPVRKCLSDARTERSSVHDVVFVGGSTRIPRVRRLLQDVFDGKELRRDINAEEAVARGAAILAAVVNSEPDSSWLDLFLQDATPRSIGVEVAGGAMAVLIAKNTTIPIRTEQMVYLHSSHGKRGVLIRVFEGENPTASENNLLGELYLPVAGVHHGAKRLQVSVCFEVDADGVLTVLARDMATKHKNQMRFMDKGQLSKEEIAGMFMAEEKDKMDRFTAKNLLLEHLFGKRSAIEGERKKLDGALSDLELMIQQVHDDQVSSPQKFQEALEGLEMEFIPVAS